MLEIAKDNLGTKVKFLQANLADPLDFLTDQSFDLVVASLSMHYIQNWYPVFKEFHRVLRSGGWVIFSTHNPLLDFSDSPTKNYYQTELIETSWNLCGNPFHVRYYRRPFNEILTPVLSAGFRLDKVTEPLPVPKAKEVDAELYEFFCSNPCFLFIRAQKPLMEPK